MAAVAAVSACTNAADGTPRPAPGGTDSAAPTSESSSPAPTTSGDVPRVSDPLDATSFVAEPCTSLTTAQLAEFKVGAGKPHGGDGVFPPGCGWHSDNGAISVAWLDENKNGLADTYRRRDVDPYFIETTVDGYPAVFTDFVDDRAKGQCGIVVAVSDTMTFYALVSDGPVGDAACDMAKQVGSATLTTVKAGS
jgi:hypothetical protein